MPGQHPGPGPRLLGVGIALALALLPVLSLPPEARADCDQRAPDLCQQIQQQQNQQGDLQSRLSHIQTQIHDVDAQAVYLSQLMQQLQSQIAGQRQAIQATTTGIATTERQIRFSKADITRREAHLAVRGELLDLRVRALSKEGSTDYLAVMVTSTSFTQLVDRVVLLQDVIRSDRAMVNDLQHQRDQVNEVQSRLAQQQTQLEGLLRQQQAQEAQLESDLETRQQAMAYEQQLEAQLQQQSRDMEAEIASQSGTIAALQRQYQDKIRSLDQGQPAAQSGGGRFIWPVNGFWISQGFGCTDLVFEPYWPSCPTKHFHTGIDLAVPQGTPIHAAGAGVVLDVISTAYSGGYGNRTVVQHAGNYLTTYNHQASIVVSPGDYVQQGQVIGYVGSTGNSTGPHLHFEICIGGVANFQNPCSYLGC